MEATPESTIIAERQQTFAERQAIKGRIKEITEKGKLILEGSNIVNPGAEITNRDLKVLRNFYTAVAPTPESWPQTGSNWSAEFGPWEHLQLTGIAARVIAEKLQAAVKNVTSNEVERIKSLNPDEMEALGLLHDLGRLVTHDMYRSDVVSDMLFKRLGIREDLKMKLHSIDFFYGRWKGTENKMTFVDDSSQISIEQRIMKMADTLGKRVRTSGEVRTVDNFLAGHAAWVEGYGGRPPKKWGTERKFRRIIDQYAAADKQIVISISDWLSSYEVDVDKVSEKIGQRFQNQQTP